MSENSERFRAPDTSHYDDCRGLMESFRTHRTIRLVLAGLFCVISLFIHTFPLLARGTSFGMLIGLLSIPFTGLVMWQAVMAKTDNMSAIVRLLVVLAAGAVLQMMNAGAAIALMIVYVTQIPESRRLDWLKTQEGYPHFEHYITIQEYGLEEYHPHHDTDDMKHGGKMPELSANERDKDNIPKPSVMPSAEGIAEMKAPPKREMPARPSIPVPAAFAGISPMETAKPAEETAASEECSHMEQATSQVLADLSAPEPEKPVSQKKKRRSSPWLEAPRKKAVIPEPEVPAVDFDIPTDIPDPVWDIPDPVMDTSAVVTSFPEIAGDIADLPEIPDIPKL